MNNEGLLGRARGNRSFQSINFALQTRLVPGDQRPPLRPQVLLGDGPFRVPRAVTVCLALITGYRGGAVGLAVFAFVVVLYALFSASSGAYAPEARQRAFAKELRREARESRCEPCAA